MLLGVIFYAHCQNFSLNPLGKTVTTTLTDGKEVMELYFLEYMLVLHLH